MVAVRDASKTFGQIPALQSLNLRVPPSRITVLLGPNGAGKTTAMRLITGALAPDDGSVRVFGLDPVTSDGEEVRRRCGVVSAKPSLYDRLSGYDNLRYAAELYGLSDETMNHNIQRSAAQFGIDMALDQRVGGYSTGMKTRLALARATLHDPDLLLLDEPTSGLDPESAQAVLAMVRDMTSNNKSVLMCTHLLAEAEGLADEVVVIDAGTDLETGSQQQLTGRYWPDTVVHISVDHPGAQPLVSQMAGVRSCDENDDVLAVHVDGADRIPAIVDLLVQRGIAVKAVVPQEPTLEDLYFAIRRRHHETTGPTIGPDTATDGARQ